jgi:hypothetical protein
MGNAITPIMLSLRKIRPSLALLLTASLWLGGEAARAQMEYVENVPLPVGHDPIIREVTAPVDTTEPGYDPSYQATNLEIVTTKQIYWSNGQPPGTPPVFAPLYVPFGIDISLYSGSIALNYNQQENADDNGPYAESYVLVGTRDSIFSYNFADRLRKDTVLVNTPAQKDAIALGQGLYLIASNNQIFSTPASMTGSLFPTQNPVFTSVMGGTGTGPGQFTNLTEMAIAPGASGLLFALDWGAQEVDAFNLSNNTFAYSFNLPAGLTLNNTTGLGFTVDSFGHILVADGNGGGVELSETGALIASFDPPAGDVLGINTTAGDASFIISDPAGDVYVEDGANGLHQYYDVSAVPEPPTYASLAGLCALIVAFWQRRKLAARG